MGVVDLGLPVSTLRGIGDPIAQKLKNLGIYTIQDVLFHLPSRYEDRTQIVPLGELQAGARVSVEGEIELTQLVYRRRRMMVCQLADYSGVILLRFFHFNQQQKRTLAQGTRLRCYGEVQLGAKGFEMVHPEYHCLSDNPVPEMEKSLTPIYPKTQGIHQLTLRRLTDQALSLIQEDKNIKDLVPLPGDYNDYTLAQALRYLHRPPPDACIESIQSGKHPCLQRLAFEELLAHRIGVQKLRYQMQQYRAPVMGSDEDSYHKLRPQLGFDLTSAQMRVIAELLADLKQPHPMMRLVQGDVGSGKTVVATVVAMQVLASGYQVALMAPTEILAEQHFRNLDRWLTPLDIQLAWLSGRQKGKTRQQAMLDIEQGKAQLVVGTHALVQEAVVFKRLGLIIVDEQHRFGVHQRLKLVEKGTQLRPHQLIMTATPIPRTLAMSIYADLDTSIIDELPPGRQPIKTAVIPETRRDQVIERVKQVCRQGEQAYWVCPLIDESEVLQAQAATKTYALLKQDLPHLKIALIHGRLKPREKDWIMEQFKSAQIHLLVATVVIEVGVDAPNASLIIIENAERLGLAQLHQLRGRIGRGRKKSACTLLYKPPLSEIAKARLAVMRQTNNGFEIANRDLELRGPGEVLGTRQTGDLNLRVADLLRDQAMMAQVGQTARLVFEQYPQSIQPLLRRWLKQDLRFADV